MDLTEEAVQEGLEGLDPLLGPETPLDDVGEADDGSGGLELVSEPSEDGSKRPKTKKRPPTGGLGLAGRVRNDGAAPGVTAPVVLRHVPRPKAQTYKSDSPTPSMKPKAAFTWCRGLPEWARSKVLAYVYRDWPYLKAIPDPPQGERRTEFAYIDKISGTDMVEDEVDLLNRYGCGRYRLILNEENERPGEGSKTLCTVFVTGLTNDMKSFPPADRRISDINQVDLTHPDNRAYIEFLRMRGLMPEQRNEKDIENEMATATAVSEMTGLVKELVQDRNKNTNDSDGKSMDLIAAAAERSMNMTQKAAEDYARRTKELDEEIQKRREALTPQTTAVAAAPAESPLKLALEIVGLMNSNRGSDDVLNKFMEMTNKNFERLEKIVEGSLNRPMTQPTPITERVKDLKELRDMSETLWPHEKDEAVGDAVVDAASEMGPKWLRPYMPLLVPVLTGLAQAWMQPRPAGPMAVPGPVQQQYPPQGYQPSYPPYPQPYPQSPAPAHFPGPQPMPMHSQPGPVAVPPQSAIPPGMPPEVLKLMQMIELPFLNHITNPTLTGTDFAGWFQDGMGISPYDQVAAFGPESLFQAIASYPPIAQELFRLNMPEKRVRDFVAEFCDPKWENEGGKDKEETPQTPPAPSTPPAPAPVA